MEEYYQLSQQFNKVSEHIDTDEVLQMTNELKILEEIYKPKFTKPHILKKTTGGTLIWIDTSYKRW